MIYVSERPHPSRRNQFDTIGAQPAVANSNAPAAIGKSNAPPRILDATPVSHRARHRARCCLRVSPVGGERRYPTGEHDILAARWAAPRLLSSRLPALPQGHRVSEDAARGRPRPPRRLDVRQRSAIAYGCATARHSGAKLGRSSVRARIALSDGFRLRRNDGSRRPGARVRRDCDRAKRCQGDQDHPAAARRDRSRPGTRCRSLTALMGLSDGFNPCAMWVLIYLISLIAGIQDQTQDMVARRNIRVRLGDPLFPVHDGVAEHLSHSRLHPPANPVRRAAGHRFRRQSPL